MAEGGGDVIVDFKTGRTWAYAWGGVGLSPTSLFKRYKSAGATKAVGLIWNFNNPNEWAGFSVGANWPARILHLLPAASFSSSKMWGAMTQLAKRDKNARSSDLTVQIGVSPGGPVAVRLSQRANNFSASVGLGSSPKEIPTGNFGSLARQLANDFGVALDEF